MILRQLFDQASSTFTYLLADAATREAVLIDPVFEQHARDKALIRELGLTLLCTVDTHCHADHVTGAWLMKAALGSAVCLAREVGAENVDRPLGHGDVIRFGGESLQVRATPGHTDGCLSLVTGDRAHVFTGDALLVRAVGRTDFQRGDSRRLYRSIHEQLFTLPGDCVVHPGHDYQGRTCSTILEEKLHNPRIGGGAREEDFTGFMRNLELPHPKLMAAAVPANLRAGRPEDGKAPAAPAWGPVVITYAGLPEIAPEWVACNRRSVTLLDVRSAAEFEGELGHLDGAQLIPLDELRARTAEVSCEKPVVVICQTGRRSALGTQILSTAGRTAVANLAGGMVRWRELGLPAGKETRMLLDELWDRYAAHVPYARAFVQLAGALQNDHVAFRSLDLERVAPIFESLGWKRAGAYDFPDARLDAIYLSKPGQPRIFVSQLRQRELSPRARDLLARLPAPEPFAGDANWFRAPAEPLLSETELLELESESQYAAWLMLFDREVNHFTASVDDVEKWQARMIAAGIPMKAELEGAPKAGLRQTATKAAPRRVQLRDGARDWPYAYLEIAQRNGGFDGFVAAQARQLFEITRR